MSIFLNPDEILEMSEQIERNGARFYHQAAEATCDSDMRTLLEQLAAMEEAHEKIFAKMRATLTKDEITFNADPQISAYLKAWADEHAFDMKSDPLKRVKDQKDMEGILTMAIGLEKETIMFYLGLQHGVNKKKYQDRIDDIIKEEMGHVSSLNTKLLSLKK